MFICVAAGNSRIVSPESLYNLRLPLTYITFIGTFYYRSYSFFIFLTTLKRNRNPCRFQTFGRGFYYSFACIVGTHGDSGLPIHDADVAVSLKTDGTSCWELTRTRYNTQFHVGRLADPFARNVTYRNQQLYIVRAVRFYNRTTSFQFQFCSRTIYREAQRTAARSAAED